MTLSRECQMELWENKTIMFFEKWYGLCVTVISVALRLILISVNVTDIKRFMRRES